MKLQIVIDGQPYEVEVDVPKESVPPQLPGTATIHSAIVPTTRKGAPSETDVDEQKLCRSPVNGLVVKVLVFPSQTVNAGDLIIVLEAMKMETEVTAPVTCKVKDIKVAPGDAVRLDQVLAEFE